MPQDLHGRDVLQCFEINGKKPPQNIGSGGVKNANLHDAIVWMLPRAMMTD
jgi:hypothetical protein